MIISTLLALQSPVAPPPQPAERRPIRIWMDAAGPVTRGRGVRLYVEAAEAGNLVVLHSRSDGRIEVLFPARPTDDPHITPGTYEVRGQGDGPVWTVAEPDGNGMILAALSPDPIWFNEFAHDASWNPSALTPSWSGADAAGGMTDIVQRMLGDGGFTYDVLPYTVVTAALAQAADSDSSSTVASTLQPDDAALTTCGVSSPVECQLMGQPLYGLRGLRRGYGRGAGRGGFGRPAPGATASRAPMPAVATPLVLPVRRTPLASRPVEPRPRFVAGVQPRIRALAPRPVAGASPDRLAGAAPAARSALVLRYVRPRVAPAPSTRAVAAPLAFAVARPGPGLRETAAVPGRAQAVTLMSRAVPAPVTDRIGGAPTWGAARVARPAPAAPPSQSHGTRAGWLVMGGRGRSR